MPEFFPNRAEGGARQADASLRRPLLLSKPAPMTAWARALARTFRRKRMHESEEFATIAQLAEREGAELRWRTNQPA